MAIVFQGKAFLWNVDVENSLVIGTAELADFVLSEWNINWKNWIFQMDQYASKADQNIIQIFPDLLS